MKITDFVDIYLSEDNVDGNMSVKYGGIGMLENRRRFYKKNNIDGNKIAFMYLNLEGEAQYADKPTKENEYINVNSLVTDKKDLYLALVVADCSPVILFDTKKEIVALVHCGRFNVENRILENTLDLMKEKFNTNPKDLLVYIGPSIKPDSYMFDKGIFDQMKKDSEIIKTLHHVPGEKKEYRVDVPLSVKNILKRAGVKEEDILDIGIDTFKDERYPSHVYSVKHNLPESRFLVMVKMKDLS
jgi:hypothetical protein